MTDQTPEEKFETSKEDFTTDVQELEDGSMRTVVYQLIEGEINKQKTLNQTRFGNCREAVENEATNLLMMARFLRAAMEFYPDNIEQTKDMILKSVAYGVLFMSTKVSDAGTK